ncbi:MAG TPA: Ig-like domain repeat protein [Blastocatellia bacterium]|nr:Ig-like domain repeat protein [Blastocatellia bacterium]
MNKLHRVAQLIFVSCLILGLGYWQQKGWAAGPAGNELKQFFSSAAAARALGLSSAYVPVSASPLAVISVTSLGDGAANAANCPGASCRLRDAIAKAAAGDTINFSVTGTITLTNGQLDITKNLTIDGPGAAQLTISGDSTSRVFFMTSGNTVLIQDVTIANGNSSTLGGGISNNGTLTLNNCTLSTNRATNGGGGVYNQGSLTITNCLLSGNSSPTGSGGGIFTIAGLTNISGSTFTNNSANAGGGLASTSTSILTDSTLYDNSTNTNGGGIFNQGTLGLTNTTLSGNDATAGSGGGLYGNSSASSILNNCTLHNNSAASGGGIEAVSGLLQARNTIVAGNTATGLGQDISGSLNSVGNNLIGNSSGVTIGGDPFSNILNVNARLAPLANYGGATLTHALLPGSPAIDAGDDCVNQSGGCLSTALANDQRGAGFSRKVGSKVDIGAFESRGFTLSIASGNNQSAAVNAAFNSLSVNVTSSFGEPTSGGQVTFTAPAGGASASVGGNPATITNGTALTGTVLANGIGGTYNVAASAKGAANVNFVLTNTIINTAPSFTPAAAISLRLGSSVGTTFTVGTVADGQTSAGALTVTQIVGGTASGITVTGFVNTNGTITASVSSSCTATAGTVRILVSDGSLTGTGDLQINLTANVGPTLAYTTASVMLGSATTIGPAIGPVDNGSISNIVVDSAGAYTGTISVNAATGVVSLSNAGPLGNHTISIRATDNCNASSYAQFTLSVTATAPTNRVFGFGVNSFGELSIPNNVRSGATAIAAGAYHSLVLNGGQVYAYGYNLNGQTDVPTAAQSGVTAVAAAYNHSLALKNGGVIAWGELGSGVPVEAQSGVSAIAAGDFHDLFLKNGGVIGRGSDSQNQITIPVEAQSGVTAIAAGGLHSLALKNGGVIAWGYNFEGQTTVPAEAQSGVTAIAAGERFSLAVKNGGVIGWGRNLYNEINIPVAAQSGVIAVAARYHHGLALKSTGEVIAWGQGAPGIPAFAQSGVLSISTGDFHHLVLKPSSPPTITAGTLARQQGTAGSFDVIATVIDSQTSAGNLTVTAANLPFTLPVASISNNGGTITANVAATCLVTPGEYTVALTVTDEDGESATADLTVNVTANSAPTLVYSPVSVNSAGATTNTPTTATDNGSIASYAVQSDGTFTGTISVNSSGVVSISNAAPAGNHNITIRATDNCGTTTDAVFTLTVNTAATTTTITNAASLSATPTVVGEAYAVNVSVSAASGTPTGTVTVSDGSQSCTITLPATSCNLTSTSPGTAKTISATYNGSTNFSTSFTTTTHRVNKANTTTTITNAAALATATVIGQVYSVAASIAINSPGAGTPGGTITVSNGAQTCTISLPASSCNLTGTAVGASNITATYNGDSNFNNSVSTGAPHTVNKAGAMTVITNAAALAATPTVIGQAVAINWTVTVNVPGAPVVAMTGNVTVSDGTQSCTAAVSAGTCSIAFNSIGAKTLTAVYAGDANYNGSTSADAPHQVSAAATTTTITNAASLSSTPTVVGQSYAVNVSVTAAPPATGTPTGTVTVSDGSQSCTITLPATSCSLTSTSPGAPKTITASYNGDADFSGSSTTVLHTVNKAVTTLGSLTDSPDPSVVGQAYTVGFALSVTSPGAGTPTGAVTINDGTGGSCTANLPATSCSLTSTMAGAKTLTFTYNGDANFNSSNNTTSHTASNADTTTTITNSVALGTATVVGQAYSVAAAVSVVSPGAGTPTGTITVSDGSQTCAITLPATSCNLTSTTAGAKTITATYNGDANFNGDASPGVPHTVNAANTTTAITSDNPDPSTIGQTVTVNFTVTVNAPGGGTPTGNVVVTISGGTETCTGTVAAGSCTITLTDTGNRTLTATYAGSANYNSSSDTEMHQVSAAATTTTITNAASLSATPTVVGQSYAVNVSVTAAPPATGTPTGTVTVSDGSQSCTITLPATSCSLTSTSPGAPKTITASYNGDADFSGSSTTVLHTVNKAVTTLGSLTDSPDPSVVGQAYTVGFALSVTSPGAGTPTGTVTINDGTGGSCTANLPATSCLLTSTTAGAKTLTFTYNGDANFNGSNNTAGHQVNKASTTTSITADTPDPSVYGANVVVNFSVVANAPGGGTPTGNVVVTVSGGAETCTGTVASGTCTLALTALGNRTLTATYAGDDNYNGSTDTEAHTVNKADTTLTIVSDNPDSSAVGQSVTVAFTVAAASPGAGTPSGNVVVTVSGGSETCTGTIAAGSCTLSLTTPGARTLTATYASDSNFNGSSDTESHSVIAPPIIAKTFGLASTPIGGTTTLTLTITNPASNNVALTGVGFTDAFPTGLVVATPLAMNNTCGGTVTNDSDGTLTAGASGIKLSGGGAGVGNTCTVSVNVTPTVAGPFVNVTGNVSSANGGTGNTATATLLTNTPPTISSNMLTTQAGSNAASFTIATATDPDQPVNTLGITINGHPTTASMNGVTVSNVTITASGAVTAIINTSCAATSATFALVITDNETATGSGTLTVNVQPNQPPALSYVPQTVTAGTTPLLAPLTGPADNGTITALSLQSVTPNNGGLTVSVNSLTGQVQVTGATLIGNYAVIIVLTDNCGATATATLPVNVVCPTVSLTPSSLPAAAVNTAYSPTVSASPAGGNYTFAVTSGLLPTGLALNSNGTFSGAPTQSGTFNFRIAATGFGACSAFQDYILTVNCPTLSLTPTALPGGTLGTTYNQAVMASPAAPAGSYSYSVSSGVLPTGLTLNAATGVITGTPTSSGTFNFTITAAAGACATSRGYSVTIACTNITLASLANGETGVSYTGSVAASPTSTYGYSLIAGSLPMGLTLNTTSGALTGLPTATGTYNFTIKAQQNNGCSGQRSYTLLVACPSVTLSALPTPTLNSPYSQTVTASPSGGNYSYAVTVGFLPTGLSLNAATGAISGTPTAAGTYNFTITASGFGNCTGNRAYTGTIVGSSCPTITLTDLPSGQPGQLYSNAVTASPAGSYSYAVTSGSLPPGLTLYGSFGLIYGYPTTAGTFNFTITATDINNCTGSKAYNVQIGGAASRSPVFGDFDGDGKADLSVWRGASGQWLTINSSDGKLKNEAWGTSAAPYFDAPVPGDYDGDGKMDLAVFRRATGEWFIKGSRDGAVTTKLWGLGTDIPVPGDYDGDGKTDIAVWRGSDTNWYIVRSSDSEIQTVSWGTSKAPYNDVPVAADFDGDGKTDVAVFRQANGHWYIRQSSNGAVTDKTWGLGSDVPVAADYDGDGRADIAVRRGAEGNWYIVRSSDGEVQTVSGTTSSLSDVPTPGDFDGDGKADIAVWRASTGEWFVKSSRDGSVMLKTHGQTGDMPLPRR